MPVTALPPRTADRLPCRNHDPDLFFAERPEEVAAAKLVCAGCPIKDRCREEAIQRGEQYGVWGGQLIVAGVLMETKRGRGRPRKNAVA